MSFLFLFFIYTIVLFIGAGFVGFLFWKRIVRREGDVSRSLGMTLFSVLLPKISPADTENLSSIDRIREKVSVMEQLFRSFGEIKDSWWNEFFYWTHRYL